MKDRATERSWDNACKRLARRINFGWWLQAWLPQVLAVALVGCIAVLLVRIYHPQPISTLSGFCAAAIVLTMVGALKQALDQFEDANSARVRLEDALGLHAQLSAAAAGAAPWPPLPDKIPSPVRWKWQRAAAIICLGLSLLGTSLWLPITATADAKPHVIEKPAAVAEVESWMEKLREEKAVNPQSLAAVEKQIEDLIQRPQDQWYQHASLEAADHLREETGKALQELGTQMERSRQSLNALSEAGTTQSQDAKSSLAKEVADNLNALRSGAMKAGSDLADQLRNIDPNSLEGMSKEQMQSLAERLKQNAAALREALAGAPKFDFKECPGTCKKPGEGEGEDPDKGGVSRGKGDVELTVKQNETNLHTKTTQDLSGMIDPERVAPGDLLGLTDAKPTVDQAAFKGPTAGGAANIGQGGSAVWQSQLVPAERETLKRYFK